MVVMVMCGGGGSDCGGCDDRGEYGDGGDDGVDDDGEYGGDDASDDGG